MINSILFCSRSCPASLEAGLTRAVLDEARTSYLSAANGTAKDDNGDGAAGGVDQPDFARPADAPGMPPKNGRDISIASSCRK